MLLYKENPRFLIAGLAPYTWDKETVFERFEETELLIKTYGGIVFAAFAQNAARADNATYLGRGKVEEIAGKITEEEIDVVVLNDIIKPTQIFNLKKIFRTVNPEIEVWDRADLILEIFDKHAITSQAKLQIKLAKFRHMGPLIFGMGHVLSQQGAGIGTRGMGETNTEIMRRHFRSEVGNIRKELEKIEKNRKNQMDRRKRDNVSTVSIVGYTNAGKTSLFNALGKVHNLVEDALFATLDSAVCKLFLPSNNREVYLSDTIGFIQNLPPSLIDAFKSTLMETVNSDLIMHVIDVSDKRMHEKITVVEDILHELKIELKNRMYVFNKIDIAKAISRENLEKKYKNFHPRFISAKMGTGCKDLLKVIDKLLI